MSLTRSAALLLGPTAGLLITVASAAQAAPPPAIRYLDVDSAAFGSFVGIYGQGFGSTKGKVSIGTTDVADYPLWTDTVIVARIPAGAVTAPVTVQIKNGPSLTTAPANLKIHNGNSYFVSVDTGSDTNPGDETGPFKTIAKALTVVLPGDTVLVRAGIYDEVPSGTFPSPAVFFKSSVSGTEAKPITLRGWGDQVPTLQGSSELAKDNPILFVGGDWVRIARIKVDGTGNLAAAISAQGSNLFLAGVEVTGFTEQGILIGEGTGNTISGNHVHHGGTVQGVSHGIVFTGSTGNVDYNEVDHLDNGYGIVLQYQSQASTLLSGNFIHDTAGGGFGLWRVRGGNRLVNNVVWNTGLSQGCQCALEVSYGAQAGEAATIADRIYYNTFAGPGLVGLSIADRAGTAEVHGNIFGDFVGGIDVADSVSRDALKSSHNLWFLAGGEPKFRWGAAYVDFNTFKIASQQEAVSLLGDPMFVDAAKGDLHLAPGSAAIDMGGGPDQPTTDYDGVARPQGKDKDWGAFEAPASDAGYAGASGGDAAAGDGQADGKVPEGGGDANGEGGGEAGSPGDGAAPGDDGGCGCSTPGMRGTVPAALLLALAGYVASRRRRR